MEDVARYLPPLACLGLAAAVALFDWPPGGGWGWLLALAVALHPSVFSWAQR